MAIGLSELEVLDEEILDFGMVGDGSGTVAHIAKSPLRKIIIVQ